MQRKEKDNRPLRRLVVYSLKQETLGFLLFYVYTFSKGQTIYIYT